ncbi:hypothetical protein C2869_04165 [Saccharobesus litoralis]|uniref:Right handed beta helix domain-containing protein n=1 Tax=Saccharobesus litoralis TaxID=2172099 RepID=A0A2S0VN78_9ALTE|nr:right-handed parallel beta-helix repeat-containing protein [Saccharobesus litoralis]AWB65681.1 hypothetical protein C2869_04165 [Saccharobesus litoralis]
MKYTLLSSAIALAFSSTALAKTVYVAPNGDDSNDGSQNAPFATFAQANSVLTAGDTLMIAGGEYRQTLKISQSGNADNPIKVRALNDADVLITATESLSGWSQHSGNIYSASVNMTIDREFRQVYHKDKLMQIARWPNDSDNDVFTIDAHELHAKGSDSSIAVSGIPNLDLTGGYMWYLGEHSGTSWTRTITSNSQSQINFTKVDITKWPFSNHNPSKKIDGGYGRFFVFGTLELLDNAKEWFYDSAAQTLYFQPADGQQPSDGEVEYTARQHTVELNGNFIDVEGIDVWGGNVRLVGNNNRFAAAKITHGRERLDALNNSSAQIGDGSIYVQGQNALIENNVLHHGSISGIFIAGWQDKGNGSQIIGNEIRYFDTLGIHASPIRSGADNVKILKNTISDTGRDGMYVSGTDSEIAYNDVSRNALINNDGGLFYTVGNKEPRNIEIHHNWWHDAVVRDYNDNRIAGIYLDNNSKGFLVHHNVVWNVPWSALQLNWDNWDNHIYHNTFIDAEKAMGEWINGHNPRDNRVWNNFSNKLDWIQSAAYDLDSNLIDENVQQLVDPSKLSFMPKQGSDLLDKARTIDDFTKPFTGPAPDIGAYEAGGIAWTAGVNAIEDKCVECKSDPTSEPVFGAVEPTPDPDPDPTPEPDPTPAPTPDPKPDPEPETSSSSGGGSLGFTALLLAWIGLRRRG